MAEVTLNNIDMPFNHANAYMPYFKTLDIIGVQTVFWFLTWLLLSVHTNSPSVSKLSAAQSWQTTQVGETGKSVYNMPVGQFGKVRGVAGSSFLKNPFL